MSESPVFNSVDHVTSAETAKFFELALDILISQIKERGVSCQYLYTVFSMYAMREMYMILVPPDEAKPEETPT